MRLVGSACICAMALGVLFAPTTALAASADLNGSGLLLGVPFEFLLFAATLISVAVWHHSTLQVAAAGLAAIVGHKLAFAGFTAGPGLVAHLAHERVTLANPFLLLMGFALLSRHFGG